MGISLAINADTSHIGTFLCSDTDIFSAQTHAWIDFQSPYTTSTGTVNEYSLSTGCSHRSNTDTCAISLTALIYLSSSTQFRHLNASYI